jgi:TetR/AcrR family transcriptional regulator, transcriptional repressor for nem operon
MMRERGIAASSVDEVMAAAGLTRGGFYAHFKDKTALAREVLEQTFERAFTRWLGDDLPTDSKAWKRTAAERYLSEAHLVDPGRGCAAPSLGAEVARGEPELQTVVGKQVERIINGISERIGGDETTARPRAIAFMATCVGAMVLARSVGKRKLGREILQACSDVLTDNVRPGERDP